MFGKRCFANGLHRPDGMSSLAISTSSRKLSLGSRSGWHSPPGVLIRGSVYDGSGYADEARGIILGLHHAGVPVQLEPLGLQYDANDLLTMEDREEFELLKHQRVDLSRGVLFQDSPANHFNLAMYGRHRVLRTMFETDSIPDGWRDYCEAMEEVWVPTLSNVEAFASAGVSRKRLHVLPSGVDTTKFRPGLEPFPIPARRGFNFLSVFEWIDRKGPDVLMRAYLSEFKPSDDVALILKTYSRPDTSADLLPRVAYFVEREMGMQIEDAPNIVVIAPDFLPTTEVPRLYASIDAFVLASRGEGYGRPYMEALACECPVIATRWSGQMDFLHDANSYLVDYEVASVPWNVDTELYAGHHWAEPSVEHLGHLMRKVFEHREEAKQKAIRGRAEMVEKWDWNNVIRERWVPAFERLLR
jgi:glycosyltransferase involved in cell wall biosynthesis